jgi:O-6-methylguanine DNA methyltransferase
MNEQLLFKKIQATPYGDMIIMATKEGLSALEFIKPDRNKLLMRRIDKWFSEYTIVNESNTIIDMTVQWLENYFSGKFADLNVPSLDLRGTEFELKVWQQLLNIPLGETASYQDIAEKLGIPRGGGRAVGNANRRNPISIIVPCHRVIGKSGKLVGYGGGLDKKEAFLTHEIPSEQRRFSF